MTLSREARRAIANADAHPVLPGYQRPSTRERLEKLADLPIGPRRYAVQLPPPGMFDEGTRSQLDLSDYIRERQAEETQRNRREQP